jgi:hypothetical protein
MEEVLNAPCRWQDSRHTASRRVNRIEQLPRIRQRHRTPQRRQNAERGETCRRRQNTPEQQNLQTIENPYPPVIVLVDDDSSDDGHDERVENENRMRPQLVTASALSVMRSHPANGRRATSHTSHQHLDEREEQGLRGQNTNRHQIVSNRAGSGGWGANPSA